MKNQELIISEITEIRKKMGLPTEGNQIKFLNEIFNKKLILEQGEVKIIDDFLKELFPSLAKNKYTQEEIGEILARNKVEFTLNGKPYLINSLESLENYVRAVRKIKAENETLSTTEILRNIFSDKTNDNVTQFKKETTDNLNWMSMKKTRSTHTIKKNDYLSKTSIKNENGVEIPFISSGAGDRTTTKGKSTPVKPLDLPINVIDDVFDDLEKTYLGKTNDKRTVSETDFSDSWLETNVSNKTEGELTNIANTLTKEKEDFTETISYLKKKVTDEATIKPPKKIANITKAQEGTLNSKLDEILLKSQGIYDNIITYYEDAALNKKAISETIELTEKKERNIFEFEKEDFVIIGKEGDNFDYMLSKEGVFYKRQKGGDDWVEMSADEINTLKTDAEYLKKIEDSEIIKYNQIVDNMLNNVDNELLGERNWFIRWIRNNKSLSGDGFWAKKFKMPFDNLVSFWSNNKRLFERSEKGSMYWYEELTKESSGRYSYAEVNIRMKYIVNEMQRVIKESLTNIEGKTFKNPGEVERRLKDLMKEMRDIASLQKFAGNLDEVMIKDPNDPTGKRMIIDTNKVNDPTRIFEENFKAQINELTEIANNFKRAIDDAATENVVGAKELKEFWERSSMSGEKTNIEVMSDFLRGMDDAAKEAKSPVTWMDPSIWKDIAPFLKWFSGESWSSKFKDVESIGKGSWLLNNKLGRGVGSVPVLGGAVTKGSGAIVAFFKTLNEMFFRDFLFGALWNQFKYGRLTSVDELNRIMAKYGPVKQGIILFMRETVTAITVMAVASAFTEMVRGLDKLLGGLTSAVNDLPLEEKLALGINELGEYIDSDGLTITADRFKEYLEMDMMDRVSTFFYNPINLNRLIIGSGFPADILNLLTLGSVSGDNPEYFNIRHDKGWFSSQLDEAILDVGSYMYTALSAKFRGIDSAEEQFNTKLEDAKKRLQRWEATGIYYGQEHIKEINNTENNVRNGIEGTAEYENFPESIYNDKVLFNKLKTLIALEHEPDFREQLKDVDETKKEIEGGKLWAEWYKTHMNNVGLTDENGKFWQIKLGSQIGNLDDLKSQDKLIPNKYGVGYRSYYIYNPNDGKWYDLQYLDKFFDKGQIESLWNKYNSEYVRKYTMVELNNHNEWFNGRKELLENKIKNLEETYKKYQSTGDCEKYPKTCEQIKMRIDGGTFEDTYVDNAGNTKTKTEEYKGLKNELKKLIEDHEIFVAEANKSLNIKESKKKNNNQIIEMIMKNIKSQIFESKRFDEDDYKHWKDTFTFQSVDEKNPGQYKDVKLNMDDVMDRIPHYRKKYDEDDSFVRAVVDTHENVVRFMFTKDLANIREGYSPVGFAKILQQLREARGENEIWSVARPASGNWFLVKGDFTPKELMGMDLEKNEPADREPKKRENSLETLKKKELTSAEGLKNNEKSGFNELPKVVKEKLREKFNNGWTTEEPAKNLKSFYSDSEVKSVFGDSIKIYKLNTNSDFFDSISKYSDSLPIKRGFCRSIHLAKQNYNLSDENKNTIRSILKICNNKFNDFLGLSNMS